MKNQFAKLFQFQKYQVLVIKDHKEEEYLVSQITFMNNITTTISVNFQKEKDRNKYFHSIDEPKALEYLNSVLEMHKTILDAS